MENKIHVPNHQPDMNDENICVNNRSSLASEKKPSDPGGMYWNVQRFMVHYPLLKKSLRPRLPVVLDLNLSLPKGTSSVLFQPRDGQTNSSRSAAWRSVQGIPSGNLTVCYWKWPIYSGFTHWKWWFFHSYVSLPEGTMMKPSSVKNAGWW